MTFSSESVSVYITSAGEFPDDSLSAKWNSTHSSVICHFVQYKSKALNMWRVKFSWQWLWRLLSSGMWRRVFWWTIHSVLEQFARLLPSSGYKTEVLTAWTLKIDVFWDLMSYRLVDCAQHFDGIYSFHLQGTGMMFSRRWPQRLLYSGLWHCVMW
jgi:hypothetical protein